LNGCIEPRRPLPVTPKNIVEVGLIKGLRRVAENETFGGAKIFAYRTGPQPSTPRFRLRSSAVERSLSSKRPQHAGELHLHFAGKVPALPGRRSAWPFGHSHCKSPQSSRKPHGGMNRDSGRNPCHPDPSALSHGTCVDPGTRIPPPLVAPTAHPQTSLG